MPDYNVNPGKLIFRSGNENQSVAWLAKILIWGMIGLWLISATGM